MKSKLFSVVKFLIGWPLSFVALFFLLKIFAPQASEIQQNITHGNFTVLILAFFCFALYFFFRVLLWKKILASWGHYVPLGATAWYWSIAEINRYIPGNIWSVIGRGATFSQFGIKQSTLLLGWVAESLLVLLGSLTVSLLGLSFFFARVVPSFPLKNIAFFVSIFGIILLMGAWIFQTHLKNLSFIPKKILSVSFSPSVAIQTLLFAFISFFFFGLGTYFSITSLFYLPTDHLIPFIGLFSAAFLLGYVSIITPMGLGVREFVMSAGLLAFLGQGVVGFATIYARLLLIIAEFVFLFLAFMVHKTKSLVSTKVIIFMRKHMYDFLLGLSVLLYSIYFITASFLRYTNYFTGRFDLGNMDQTVWNTLHGRIFQLTDPNGTNVMSRLATHADFILVALAPFYLIWRDPRMLLLLQTLVLAIGAVFVFLIARNVLKNERIALVISIAYLLNPSIQNTNLYDFHAVTFATTFFLAAWYFLKKQKFIWTILFLILAGLTKEEAWIIVGFFGIYMAVQYKKRVVGFLLAAFSFVAFYLLIWKLIPAARGGQHFALSYYSDFGSTPGNVIKNILFSPVTILKLLFEKTRIMYLFNIGFPLGFLSIFSPLILLFIIPELGINLLSNNTPMHEIYYQYTAAISPFLFIAMIYGVAFLKKRFRISSTIFVWYIAITTITSAYFIGPLPGAIHQNVDMFTKQQANKTDIENFLQHIPKKLSVAATNNLGSHLSHRQLIYTVPVGLDKADIIVFLLNDPYAQPSLAAQKKMVEEMKHDKKYHELFEEGDFVAFEKVLDPTVH